MTLPDRYRIAPKLAGACVLG
ncbi:L,D-transpeptidase, partial [Mesorhizobium sp. M7A.F.Ca.CA.002.04.1.1]